ncbi:MAG: hypothetical protein EIB84_07440 [Spiroplasma poulsonii]|uniref:Uncharacterized protein n=1 Tax=Spiroplasma poulsonii TaxID=2138 RepID=A0A0C2HWG0_9MOLU|nr:hypothetical protein [Spiroplasma poulsonii]KAF0850664.1 hypothetical protein MSROBK_015540 [Spiroplasma poulsonii]KAF0850682.1 hypothetical protein MSROBK_015720 [Spiroplasma poulsonii]MBW1242559.1 hypothetical protein [Spiroplasma poulsonii]PQM31674.1 hypothetical protein SMSRO_SF015250 [Spiroplasma poulsonii]PQM31692.1 hypothetical protein SMSRO_SF015430 [Spiroplasma poulsonii]
MKRIKEILKELKSKEYNILLDELEELFFELEKNQLYKEDFVIYSFGCDKCNLTYSCKNNCKLFWALKDNLDYEKLESKE